MNKPRDYADLARVDRTHVSLYTDPEVFHDEMERIFYRSWVYVAHESEIPNPGDYKTTYIGLVPVIATRDAQGKVHVLINRCTHRGATVCPTEKGNAGSFVCPYHGWEFAPDGRLVSVGLPKGYNEGEIDLPKLGLREAAKVDSYRGIIFASLLEVPDITLEQKLAGIRPVIDMYMDLSPVGEVVVGQSGVYKHPYHGNWKIQTEGSVEGYHAIFTHQTALDVMARKMGAFLRGFQNSGLKGRDVGHGNNVLEVYKLSDEQVYQRWPKHYIDMLCDAHGAQRAMEALRNRFNLVIFPNFAILEYQFRVIRPIAPDFTEVRIYHTTLKDAPPDINLKRVREHEFFYGPASFGGPDDYAAFDRIQEGFRAPMVPWVHLNRGYLTEETDAQGHRVGDLTQETQQRAPYYEYRRLMARTEG
jgi:nitrite reductase/ring-hydroxylating ferredoxin subunit